MLLRNLYTKRLEELHKELQDKVFLFNSFVFLLIKYLELVYVNKLNKYFNLISKSLMTSASFQHYY